MVIYPIVATEEAGDAIAATYDKVTVHIFGVFLPDNFESQFGVAIYCYLEIGDIRLDLNIVMGLCWHENILHCDTGITMLPARVKW